MVAGITADSTRVVVPVVTFKRYSCQPVPPSDTRPIVTPVITFSDTVSKRWLTVTSSGVRKPALMMDTTPASVSDSNRRCGGSVATTGNAQTRNVAPADAWNRARARRRPHIPTHEDGGSPLNRTLPFGHVKHSSAPMVRHVAHELVQPGISASRRERMCENAATPHIRYHDCYETTAAHCGRATIPLLIVSTLVSMTENGPVIPVLIDGSELADDTACLCVSRGRVSETIQ